jgi:hypothetical protein
MAGMHRPSTRNQLNVRTTSAELHQFWLRVAICSGYGQQQILATDKPSPIAGEYIVAL